MNGGLIRRNGRQIGLGNPPIFDVEALALARRDENNFRGCRCDAKKNNCNRECGRVVHYLLIRDYLRLHRGGVGRGSGVGRDRGVGLGLGVGVGVGVTFAPDCTSNDPMSM